MFYLPLGQPVHDDKERRFEKAEPRFEKGLYLGVERDSSEYRIGGPHGVVDAVTLKRLPPGQQWSSELIKQLAGVPWDPRGLRPDPRLASTDSDERLPEVVEVPAIDEYDVDLPDDDGTGLKFESRQHVEVRDFPLRRADFAAHGFTQGCRGCIALQRNLKPVGHDASCHTRMAELLRVGNERDRRRVERAETRIAEAILKSAQEEIRRAGEKAGKEIENVAQDVRGQDASRDIPEPMSAEQGIEAEDTTFLYGDTHDARQSSTQARRQLHLPRLQEAQGHRRRRRRPA